MGPSASVPVPSGRVHEVGASFTVGASMIGSAEHWVAPVLIAYAVVTHDGYHLAADHHDLIVYGTELALVVAFVFVSAKLVGARLLR